jgi:hypothetical protein
LRDDPLAGLEEQAELASLVHGTMSLLVGRNPQTQVGNQAVALDCAWRAVRSPRPTSRIEVENMDGSSDSKTSADRVARNQALFRSVNEQIETRSEGLGVSFERIDFVCECADEHCMAQVALRLSEYEDVRRIPTHFIVMAGHVYREFERVVETIDDDYVVVEKFGEAGKQAIRLDPRRTLRIV